jgi:tRNA U34 5-carboxymethylaminomethyl modifying GTPase MnmE/TrmE
MPEAAKRQQRKVVELSFDPESIEEFPHIDKDTKHNSSRSVNSTKFNKSSKSQKSSKSHKSNASSDSGSVVSAVTRADFTNLAEGLSKNISKLIRDECSVMTSSTDASALKHLKEELLAGRKQQEITNNTMKESLQLMSTMLAQFMKTQVQRTQPPPVSQSAHSAPFSASSVSDTNASQDPRAPHSPIIDNTQV